MTRIGLCVIAVLGLVQDVVGSQRSASVTLVDVPIPVYPPIAKAALISGDVHVTVEVRGDGTLASASVAKVEGFSQQTISLVGAQIAGRVAAAPASPYELQLAKGVRQAYVGRYLDGDRQAADVFGLLFGDENDARAFAELGAKTDSSPFLVHRQIVVSVRGINSCADAVAESIEKQ